MTPNRTFNMSKSTKRMLASPSNRHRRSLIKQAMIQAELAAQVQVRTRTKGSTDAQ